jgi:hypothetical protein
MDTDLVRRVARFAPAWLRYTLTLSEVVRSGATWVLASGDDIALWDTDAGAVLPMWPTRDLAAEVLDAESKPTPVSVDDLGTLLPFLVDSDSSVTLFPNYGDDIVVEPTAVSEDLADFVAQPTDVAGQLAKPPFEAVYDEWALLEAPGVDNEASEGAAPTQGNPPPTGDAYADVLAAASAEGTLWLLDVSAEDAVVGIVLDDRPGLALFSSETAARDYSERVDGEVSPRSIDMDALVRRWLLVAYGGRWVIAISPDTETATFVEPSRLALDIAEARGSAEAQTAEP